MDVACFKVWFNNFTSIKLLKKDIFFEILILADNQSTAAYMLAELWPTQAKIPPPPPVPSIPSWIRPSPWDLIGPPSRTRRERYMLDNGSEIQFHDEPPIPFQELESLLRFRETLSLTLSTFVLLDQMQIYDPFAAMKKTKIRLDATFIVPIRYIPKKVTAMFAVLVECAINATFKTCCL